MAFTRVAALLHGALSDVTAAQHHAATVAGDLSLADLAARAHGDLSDAPTDAHHTLYTDAEAEAASKLKSTIVTGSRTAAAGAGDQAITGAGFTPSTVLILAMDNVVTDDASWGFGDDALIEQLLRSSQAGPVFALQAKIIDIDDGGADGMSAVLKTLDVDGVTLTWTKAGAGVQVDFAILFLR